MNLTLKQIPTRLHQRLKKQAQVNRRSLNAEVLHILERTLQTAPVDQIIADVQEINRRFKTRDFTDQEIIEAVHAGRR